MIIARVGNNVLTYREAMERVNPGLLALDTLAAVHQVRDMWISDQLVLQNARSIGLDRSPEYLRKQREASEDLLRQMMLERLRFSSGEDTVSISEAQQYYERHRGQFTFGEPFVRIRHLTASSYEQAMSARTALLRGERWETIVQRYSLHPEMQIDMESRFLPSSLAVSDVPALNRVLTVMGIREVSSLYRQNGNWHFAQLLEIRQPSETPDLDWVLRMIQGWLGMERSRKDANTHIRNLYLQAEASGNLFVLDPIPHGLDADVTTDNGASVSEQTPDESGPSTADSASTMDAPPPSPSFQNP